MGCQAEITEAIVAGGGDDILAVEADQPTLHRGVVEHVLDQMDDDFARVEVGRHETKEEGHGREEHRTYHVCDAPAGLVDARRQKGLVRVAMGVGETVRGGKTCDDGRHFTPSRKPPARRLGTLTRGHWGIEGSPHRPLDVRLGKDQSRARGDQAANPGALRRTSLGLLKDETSNKVGVRNKRLTAAWDTDYLYRM